MYLSILCRIAIIISVLLSVGFVTAAVEGSPYLDLWCFWEVTGGSEHTLFGCIHSNGKLLVRGL